MIAEIVTVALAEDCPLFEAKVDRFLAISHKLLHCLIFNRVGEAGRAFHLPRRFPPVSIVCLNTLVLVEVMLQCVTKNVDVRPSSCSKGTIDPGNGASQNVESDLVPNSGFHTVLVRRKSAPLVLDAEVSAIDAQKAVIVVRQVQLSGFKIDL